MIVVDSSAVVAILVREAERPLFIQALSRSGRSCISALSVRETAIVLRRNNGACAIDLIWAFLARYGIDLVPFDEVQAKAAASAYDRYGKGIDPKARLDLADRAADAPAGPLDVPLLFKGRDFAATDVRQAV